MDIIPELGLEIIVTGKITTWSRFKTTYQIDIDKIEIAGEGALLRLIEERKKRLFNKGYFDDSEKTPLPFLPTRIGIITSPTGFGLTASLGTATIDLRTLVPATGISLNSQVAGVTAFTDVTATFTGLGLTMNLNDANALIWNEVPTGNAPIDPPGWREVVA